MYILITEAWFRTTTQNTRWQSSLTDLWTMQNGCLLRWVFKSFRNWELIRYYWFISLNCSSISLPSDHYYVINVITYFHNSGGTSARRAAHLRECSVRTFCGWHPNSRSHIGGSYSRENIWSSTHVWTERRQRWGVGETAIWWIFHDLFIWQQIVNFSSFFVVESMLRCCLNCSSFRNRGFVGCLSDLTMDTDWVELHMFVRLEMCNSIFTIIVFEYIQCTVLYIDSARCAPHWDWVVKNKYTFYYIFLLKLFISKGITEFF